MDIIDNLGRPIEAYNDFPNNLNVHNIEFGAGKNNFGKIEYPNCYLTDLEYPKNKQYYFERIGEDLDCHFLDSICDFYKTSIDRQFQNIILCNPYGFGYSGFGNAKKFFDRAGDLLLDNGRLQIIGSWKNPWCKKESFDNYLLTDLVVYKSKYQFELESFEELDENHDIIKKYNFYAMGLETTTIPNQKLTIKKTS